MLTDSQLLERLHHVLRTSDLDTATAATVRRKIEQDLGIDLSDRKPFIRQQIDLYLQSHYSNDNPEGDVEESENAKVEETENGGSASEEGDDRQEEEESDSEKTKIDSKSTTKTKKKGGGFSKPCALSPQLQKFMGQPEMARTEVVKKIWAYIKEKDLQNPANKRKILCDEMLHDLFRVKSIDMFKMNKALSNHIWPIEDEVVSVPVKPSEKKKQNKRVKEDEEEEKGSKKKGKTGYASPRPISEALMEFFGTDESEVSWSEVVKRMWDYIKKNQLQDPSDKRKILCDEKLKELFKVDTFVGFTVPKLLKAHFIKPEE